MNVINNNKMFIYVGGHASGLTWSLKKPLKVMTPAAPKAEAAVAPLTAAQGRVLLAVPSSAHQNTPAPSR